MEEIWTIYKYNWYFADRRILFKSKTFFNSDKELNTMYVVAFLITMVITVVAAGYVYFIEE